MNINTPRENILLEIVTERARQDLLKAQGKFQYTCADAIPNIERLSYLAEEFGEVSREVNDILIGERFGEDPAKILIRRDYLRAELIQVAAICLAWIEGLAAEDANESQVKCGAY